MFTVCHKVISLVYSLFQYIIGDGILLSWTGPCGLFTVKKNTQKIPLFGSRKFWLFFAGTFRWIHILAVLDLGIIFGDFFMKACVTHALT